MQGRQNIFHFPSPHLNIELGNQTDKHIEKSLSHLVLQTIAFLLQVKYPRPAWDDYNSYWSKILAIEVFPDYVHAVEGYYGHQIRKLRRHGEADHGHGEPLLCSKSGDLVIRIN